MYILSPRVPVPMYRVHVVYITHIIRTYSNDGQSKKKRYDFRDLKSRDSYIYIIHVSCVYTL